MGKSLLLGGAGFIGLHLAKTLAEENAGPVILVDNLSRGRRDADMEGLLRRHSSVQFVAKDLTTPGTLDSLDGKFDHVYLLAGIVGVRNVAREPSEVIRINTALVLNTLEWLARRGCGRFFYASTSETYAGSVENGQAPVPTPETVPLAIADVQAPRSTYAITKMLGEAAVTHFSQKHAFPAVIGRYHNVYGPRMGHDHAVPEIMARVQKRTDPFPIFGVDQTRAFCYVADAVAATLALMRFPLTGCEIVHIGNPEEVTVLELLDRILKIAQWRPSLQPFPAAKGAVARRCPDIGKLVTLTGFKPDVSLDEGLRKTWEWYTAHDVSATPPTRP